MSLYINCLHLQKKNVNRLFFIFLFFLYSSLVFTQENADISDLKEIVKTNPNKALIKIDRHLFNNDTISKSNRAILLKYKGDIFNFNKNFDKALEFYMQSYLLFKENNISKKQIELLSVISDLQVLKGNYSQAIDIQNELISLLKNLEAKDDLSSEYLQNFSQLYLKVGDYKKAFSYLNLAIDLAKESNNLERINNYYSDLSNLYLKQNQLDSAMFYSNKAQKYSVDNKDFQLCTKVLLTKGAIYEKQEEFIKAENKYKRVVKIQDSIGVNSYQANIKLGNFYKRLHLYGYAKKAFRKALKKVKSTNNKSEILDLYHDIIENALLDNNNKEARVFLKKYDALSKELKQQEQQKYNDYINQRFDLQKKEIEFLNNKHELQKKQDELVLQKKLYAKNRILFIILIALLGLLLLLSIIFLRFRRLKNEKMNIRLKNKVLGLQMNPHFIFNSLTAIQNSIMKNDILKSAELIAVFSKLIRQNLDFSARETISLFEEIEMLTNYLTTQKFRFDNVFNYKINVSDDVDIEGIQIPPMLIQPFVENAIEHGFKNMNQDGKIDINIFYKKDTICFEIIDNGIGYSVDPDGSDNSNKEVHALHIFAKRLKIRQKNEHKNFRVSKLFDEKNKVIGTKVSFCLKI